MYFKFFNFEFIILVFQTTFDVDLVYIIDMLNFTYGRSAL